MIYLENFNLKEYNAYQIEAVCKKAYFPESENDIIHLLNKLKYTNFHILGNGNNIILAKDYYDVPFIILNKCFDNISIEDGMIAVESGATLKSICTFALRKELTGLEEFYDIPSSVGGAIVMNAGNDKSEIKDTLIKVRYVDSVSGDVHEKLTEEIEFSYRNSLFQQNKELIILKAWFKLLGGNVYDINKRMQESKRKRWLKQPRELPNSGSVFKRPEGKYVGPMLDELGFKGFTIGGAQISKKHSGFIVNVGNATGRDVLGVINEVQLRVKKHFGIDLEVEQRVIY
ncbi:UDP-N-acetylenolpyruvoylglucosamine reductase [Aliidiomarina taiwanensis]|uniref:UDP-N-acetylenolpyruvoylglucosamine reductase n=1 Tax=Aliidiomarina taiwanensis TaxID=946228 RepID=A0A432WTL7_9GAMM|nr:UDP-N-acetylmuramate dehydrogenase [Aliidiomarina taiwanensis]RUO37109.1 UDP-N-acetylenolpyruvoylglucosamine reductase [Aliidiomarina taiwanensis]